MDPDRSHLSLSMAGTLAPGPSSQQQQPPAPVPPPPPPLQPGSASNNHATNGQEMSTTPVKRGPGRPKGSTKKTLEMDSSIPPKIKRPVGRPRKDGRPAGSVPKVPRGPGRPRKNFPPNFAVNTFPQQNHSQQTNGDQQDWPSLPGMFGNYRLSKESTSEPSAPTAPDRADGSSTAVDTNSTVSQNSKWFPPTSAGGTSSAPTNASSSSIANALIHPPTINHIAGASQFSDSLLGAPSALGLAGTRSHQANNTNDTHVGPQGSGEARSPIMPPAEIPEFILSTIYSVFSRPPSRNGLPLPKDVLSTYRAHLNHLSGSYSMAYNILKTFWLPYSPLLFRLVLPRTASPPKSGHRHSSASQKLPSSSSLNSNFQTHTTQSTINGDSQSTDRTLAADQTYDTHRFFYWDPFHLSLSGPLNCPTCHQAPLVHIGPIRTGPLRVFDLPSSSSPSTSAHAHAGLVPAAFYVIGMQYGCSRRACGMRFNSWDPRIINNLPQVLADEWPVHLASVSSETEQPETRGSGWSGDAVSRPLFALARSLIQVGTPRRGVRDVLARLWSWNESERDEEHDDDEGAEEPVDAASAAQNDKDKAAVVEAIFASPYQRLWTAQTSQKDMEVSNHASMMNGQRPAKRQKTNDVGSGVSTVMPATKPAYLPSRSYAPPGSGSSDPGPSGVTLQVQPPQEHRTNGSSVDNRSPRLQPQSLQQPQSQQSQVHVRRQPSQSQLKPTGRPQPPSLSHSHSHPSLIHTPSPIYPSTSLPNSTANSPQTGSHNLLGLKRALEPESHPPNSAGPPPPVPSAPGPTTTQTSPAQPHFPGIVHNSPYPHLRPLQHSGRHPSQQQPPLPQHYQPPGPARPGPPLHLHPSLSLSSGALARFNTQAGLQPHQSLPGTAPPPQPPPAPPQSQPIAPSAPPHHAPQRRVRHCVKCGQHACKGKGGSQFCKNPCKDCGGMDCRGRNSKRPNATCRDGWSGI